jgi:signal transduction histidine kinase
MTSAEMLKEMARLGKRVERERRARQEAELLAEQGIRQLYDQQRELALINVITAAANGSTSVHAAIQVTLDEICAYTGWPLGHAYFVGDDPALLHSAKIWHMDQPKRFATFRQITEATVFRRGIGLPGRVLESCRPLWVPDVNLDTNFPRNKHSLELGVRAAFAFPVLAGTIVVAVLEFFSCDQIKAEDAWLKIAAQAGIQLGRIFERQRAASELEGMHAELLELSRRAGMAEVATDVLHNVGNVLNSVGISATLVGERLKRSKVGNLYLATKMLREKGDHLGDFLTTDPKGRGLAEYLDKAAEQLLREQTELVAESASIAENVEHIKVIVSMQQRYAKASSMVENVPAFDIVQDALRMTVAAFARHGIQVIRDFDETSLEVCVDRHKVLQILINLICNAKEAMNQDGAHDKQMVIRVAPHSSDRVRISVSDNGTGIASKNLNNIFNHGFTTKHDGHGFGLHSGANAAKEMGGSLSAFSEGEGKGATFVLELPLAKTGEALSTTA